MALKSLAEQISVKHWFLKRENNCITLFIVLVEIVHLRIKIIGHQIRMNIFSKLTKLEKTIWLENGPLNVFTCLNIYLSDGFLSAIRPSRQAGIESIIYHRFGETILLN